MRVIFERTGERCYAVHAERAGQWLGMDPGPGFDPFMPHDLLHLIVESELGLDGGIFGQLERGGAAGTFHAKVPGDKRSARRKRRRDARRDVGLQRASRDQAMQSERATWICLQTWLAASSEPELRSRRIVDAECERAMLPEAERAALDSATVERICSKMDELSARWRRLGIGDRLEVSWPLGTSRASDADSRPRRS